MATFRKRGEKWIAEVFVKGERRSKTFPNKTKAKSWASEMEYQLSQQVGGVCPTKTLKDVFERYADEVSNEKKGLYNIIGGWHSSDLMTKSKIIPGTGPIDHLSCKHDRQSRITRMRYTMHIVH